MTMFLLKLRNRHFFLMDAFIVLVTPTISLVLRRDSVEIPSQVVAGLVIYTIAALFIRLFIFYRFGLYSRYWRYASVDELARIGTAVLVSTVILALFMLTIRLVYSLAFARSIIIIDALLVLLGVGGIRFSVRFLGNRRAAVSPNSRLALIMGAGSVGESVARDLLKSPRMETVPVGYLDDDPQKLRMYIHGLPVLGSRKDIPKIASERQIDLIILAMPSAPGDVIREITATCELLGIETKIVPSVYEILNDKMRVGQLRDIAIEDLLRRDAVHTDIQAVRQLVAGRRVLVTGGGGSIGRELCRQLLFCGPTELILLGHGENSIFEAYHALKGIGLQGPKLTPVIADTRFPRRTMALFEKHRPQIVFHAAAHKHVPLMELNPVEAITNNVIGTKNILDASRAVEVETFVMISTDKAVNPTSIMGASKRTAEFLVLQAAQETGRPYVNVRFGNVLGSRGSVVFTFKQQIAAGGPVTVTHPEIQRYFMTIPEAVQLVLQAAALGIGDEIFVLDMGEPIKIVDLAVDLIKLSGYEVGRDIQIRYIGLRPGDKLFEELFIPEEDYQRTEHQKIFVASNASRFVPEDLDQVIRLLSAAADRDDVEAINLTFRSLIPEYQPSVPGVATKKPGSTAVENPQVGGQTTSSVSI